MLKITLSLGERVPWKPFSRLPWDGTLLGKVHCMNKCFLKKITKNQLQIKRKQFKTFEISFKIILKLLMSFQKIHLQNHTRVFIIKLFDHHFVSRKRVTPRKLFSFSVIKWESSFSPFSPDTINEWPSMNLCFNLRNFENQSELLFFSIKSFSFASLKKLRAFLLASFTTTIKALHHCSSR